MPPQRTQEEWQVVFYVAAAIYTVGAIIYVIFAQGEIQDWAKPFMVGENKQEMAAVEVYPDETKDLLNK